MYAYMSYLQPKLKERRILMNEIFFRFQVMPETDPITMAN